MKYFNVSFYFIMIYLSLNSVTFPIFNIFLKRSLGIWLKYLDLLSAQRRVLKARSSSICSSRMFCRSFRPIDSNFVYPFPWAMAVPPRTWPFLKEFSPKESPFLRIIGSFPFIFIWISPSTIMKKELASSPSLKISSYAEYFKLFIL